MRIPLVGDESELAETLQAMLDRKATRPGDGGQADW